VVVEHLFLHGDEVVFQHPRGVAENQPYPLAKGHPLHQFVAVEEALFLVGLALVAVQKKKQAADLRG
jgi:hypothetical protein